MSLMLAALSVGLMACSDSATQATEGESEPALMQETIADKPVSSGRETVRLGSQSAQPTAAVVPVVSVARIYQ